MYNSNKVAERIKIRAKDKGISIKKMLQDIVTFCNKKIKKQQKTIYNLEKFV